MSARLSDVEKLRLRDRALWSQSHALFTTVESILAARLTEAEQRATEVLRVERDTWKAIAMRREEVILRTEKALRRAEAHAGDVEANVVIAALMAGRLSGPEAVSTLNARIALHDAQVRREALTEALHPEFGYAWREPMPTPDGGTDGGGVIWQAIQQARGEAWDEGYQRGLWDAEQDLQHGADNPYRDTP